MEVSIRTSAEVIDYAITARVVIRYSAHRPYEVRMQIGEDSRVEWIFGRELLAEGLEAPPWRAAGDGDVQVWTTNSTPPRVIVQLYSPDDDGTARLGLPWEDVARLVQRSYRVVPRGQESRHLDVDRAIRALLGGVA